MKSLKGIGLLSDVTIAFNKGLSPVLVSSGILTYDGVKGLDIALTNPRYEDRNLSGSSASIVGIGSGEALLKLDLNIQTPFDDTVKKILQTYDINIPVLQTSGEVDASVVFDVGLEKHYRMIDVDVLLSKGDMEIESVSMHILNGKMHYANEMVELKNIRLKDKIYDGVLNGKLNTKKKKAHLLLMTKKIHIDGDDGNLFVLQNKNLAFDINYNKNMQIKIPQLSFDIKEDKKGVLFNIDDLNKINRYMKNIPFIENGGDIEIFTKDFKTYRFKGVMKPSDCYFYEKSNVCKTRIPFHGIATKQNTNFYAFGKDIHYNQAKSRLSIHRVNIDLKKFLESSKKSNITQQKKRKKSHKKEKRLVILGKKSHFRYDKYALMTDSYDIEVKPNGDIEATGSCAGDIVKMSKIKDIFSLKALRIKDEVLHPLINFNGLQKGRYSLNIRGNPQIIMKGQIIIEGGVMKDFKAYKNTTNFAKSVPALSSLHKSGYSKNGFKIEKGVIEYRMIKDKKIIFDSVYIKGESATLVGKGEIDLNKKQSI